MIIERRNGQVWVWNSKKPGVKKMQFFIDSKINEIVICDARLFCTHYSIEELESMLKFLKNKNKKEVQK